MELILAGHNRADYTDITWDFMVDGVLRREQLDYLQMSVLVSAVMSAGRMASGGDPGDSLRNALKLYRTSMFPEIESDLLEKAKQNEKILEEEYKKGSLKVQPLQYSTKRKKKR